MSKTRLEAFSDGVIAIIITIMVLELRVPHGTGWEALRPLVPKLLSYLLSFVFLGIYWNNHHHLLHMADRVSGGILWANLHLLFWLSLVPFGTAWVGEVGLVTLPVALYGVVLFMAGFAYFILERAIVAHQGPNSKLREAVGTALKEWVSVFAYATAIVAAFAWPSASMGIYAGVALLWLVPDRRIEERLSR
jgi:uncharacterized membrane protein